MGCFTLEGGVILHGRWLKEWEGGERNWPPLKWVSGDERRDLFQKLRKQSIHDHLKKMNLPPLI